MKNSVLKKEQFSEPSLQEKPEEFKKTQSAELDLKSALEMVEAREKRNSEALSVVCDDQASI